MPQDTPPLPEKTDRPYGLRGLGGTAAASVLVSLCLLLQACGTDDSPPAQDVAAFDSLNTRAQTLVEVIEDRDDLDRFLEAVELTELQDLLSDLGPYTVFAPDDNAFRRGSFALDSLFTAATSDSLRKLISFHIVRGRFRPARIQDSLHVSTMLEEPLVLRRTATDSLLLVNGRKAMEYVETRNGVLYILDTVLLPPPPDTTNAAPWAVKPETP